MAGLDDLALPPGARDPVPSEGAVPLGVEVLEAKHEAMMRAGVFCAGCGEAIDEPGWQYISVRTEMREGTPRVVTAVAYICNREQCAGPRAQLEQSAAARRPWAPWHVFYVEAPDAPPEAEPPAADQAEPDAGTD